MRSSACFHGAGPIWCVRASEEERTSFPERFAMIAVLDQHGGDLSRGTGSKPLHMIHSTTGAGRSAITSSTQFVTHRPIIAGSAITRVPSRRPQIARYARRDASETLLHRADPRGTASDSTHHQPSVLRGPSGTGSLPSRDHRSPSFQNNGQASSLADPYLHPAVQIYLDHADRRAMVEDQRFIGDRHRQARRATRRSSCSAGRRSTTKPKRVTTI